MNIPEGDELKEFLESLRFMYGYDFTEYAEASLLRRIDHFRSRNQISSLHELGTLLLRDENRFAQFVQEVTINVTEMFRDPEYYLGLRAKVLKRLATYPVIKVWIAGCSTGEEVYSLAILLKEEKLLDRAIIYATDINQKALQAAREGVYPLQYMKTYTSNYLKGGGKSSLSDYYLAKYDSVLMDKSLKQNMVFAVHNLAVDQSFNEFQLVSCRNVLIYFNQTLQNKVLNLIYDSLCPFGVLGLGNKESLLFFDKRKHMEEIDRRERLFIKVK